jgi:threonine dehydrogenase-like Zn-dependent dehydrogenase
VSIPATCRAAVLVERGAPMQIIDVKVPDTIERDAILVRTRAATICATDVHLAEGGIASRDAAADLPVILGHEMTGEIVRMNGNEHDSLGIALTEGDRIVWTHGFCGQCPECVVEHMPTLCQHRRGYMSARPTVFPYLNGGFAEYGYVFPTSGRIRVPDRIPDAVAAASSCALRTVVHAFDRLGPLQERHTVVIQGAGPLGLFATAKAVTAGPEQVIVIGGPASRLALARSWGAAAVIEVGAGQVPQARVERVMELTGGRGADVVIEVSGVPAAFSEGIAMLRRGGRYAIVGQIHDTDVSFNPSQIVMKQATLTGSLSGAVDHYARALRFMDNNIDRFDWTRMITSHQPLEQINTALKRMKTYRDIKPALVFA